jgi:glycerophosphoryl diester phosphodiesterase
VSVDGFRRVGHKGADAVVPGNTLESFAKAVEIGVEMIEFDVLRLRDGRLAIAHDYGDAAGRNPLSLDEALGAFTRDPLAEVELDCDLKLPGREDELLAGLREHALVGRAMVSTMEMSSIESLREADGALRLGWTYPKVGRDWSRSRVARPAVLSALVLMRQRLPGLAAKTLPRIGVQAMWVYHPLITKRLISTAGELGVEVIAWTVDDAARIRALREIGVGGVCSNDPGLFALT